MMVIPYQAVSNDFQERYQECRTERFMNCIRGMSQTMTGKSSTMLCNNPHCLPNRLPTHRLSTRVLSRRAQLESLVALMLASTTSPFKLLGLIRTGSNCIFVSATPIQPSMRAQHSPTTAPTTFHQASLSTTSMATPVSPDTPVPFGASRPPTRM